MTIQVVHRVLNRTVRIALPLVLGGAILWWMYRGLEWSDILKALRKDMDWRWMALSMPFCVVAQWLRAVRWRQMLEPLGEIPTLRASTLAVYLSYASSLVVPRIGEVLRCGVLKRYDGVSFTRAVGTVVAERVVDMLVIGALALAVLVWQWPSIALFVDETGAGILFSRFTFEGWIVTVVCAIALVLFVVALLHRIYPHRKTGGSMLETLKDGMLSVRHVRHLWLFVLCSLGIWVAYFLHFYVAFFAFPFTRDLTISIALVAFVIGTFAVLVPTPNGAGPWHFAVKTVLVLNGVLSAQAAMFVLIVHALQTSFTALLGLYALLWLQKMNTNPLKEQCL